MASESSSLIIRKKYADLKAKYEKLEKEYNKLKRLYESTQQKCLDHESKAEHLKRQNNSLCIYINSELSRRYLEEDVHA